MSIKVAKFGGTSLANAAQIRKVKKIIESDRNRRYIIPSAPGKADPKDQKLTDLLYRCHALARQGASFAEEFTQITKRFEEIVADLGLTIDLTSELETIKEKITKGASCDYTASRGEYLNGLILANLLNYDFVDPTELISFRDSGEFDGEKTQELAGKYLKEIPYAVIPGFYGALPNGEIKTFSRGGSDITGAIIARAVGAKLYENWTDVSGFLMSDPRIIKNPKPIKKITYRELRELSYMGATVLHDESVFPVKQAGIPVQIKNTNDPDAPGTLIVHDADPITQIGAITGIAGRKDFTIIAIEKALMNQELGFGRKILSILERHHVSFEHLPSGIDTISVVIADSQLDHKLDKMLEEIKQECQPDSIEVHANMALIATVGRGMAYTPGIAGKLFSALGEEKINVRMIDQGSSEINIIVGVETDDFERAVRTIYKAFVE